MLSLNISMSLIEIISFLLIFNFFQFLIVNTFSELFWMSHFFNRVNQNLFVTKLVLLFTEILHKNFYIYKYKIIFNKFFIRK